MNRFSQLLIQNKTILIIDDQSHSLEFLSEILSENGYKIQVAYCGREGIEFAQNFNPDLILLDIILPDVDGYEVCRHLKADPETCQIPIIFISCIHNIFDIVKAFEAGGIDYITKPFQWQEVIIRVDNQIRLQSLQNQLSQHNQCLKQEIDKCQALQYALDHQNQFKQSILTSAPVGIAITDQQGYFLEVNPAYCQLYGYAESQGLTLELIIDVNLPQYIKADERKLRQILINLLGNAIKFTLEGGISLEVTSNSDWRGALTGTTGIKFAVSDTGIGIPSEQLTILFEPFVQAGDSLKSQEGVGLGLAISQKFAHLMGGSLAVASQVDQGSTFSLMIPLKTVTASEIPEQGRGLSCRRLAPNQGEYRILVVAHHQETRFFGVSVLEKAGFQVRSADNGQEGIQVWEQWHPQLILMGVKLPILDGYAATAQIKVRQLHPHVSQPTIVVAMMASLGEAEESKIWAVGFDDWISLPLQEAVILDKIAQYLGVKYCQQTPGVSGRMPASSTVSLSSLLQRVSPIWLEQLHQAALAAREKRLWQLIEEISGEHPELATVLGEKVSHFRLDQILAEIESQG